MTHMNSKWLKSRDFTFGMHSYSTKETDSLKRKVNDFVTLTSIQMSLNSHLEFCCCWGIRVSPGIFQVFDLRSRVTFLFSMELNICQFGIQYFSVRLTREEGEFKQMPIKVF